VRLLVASPSLNGLRCLIADTIPKGTVSCPAPRSADMRETAVAAVAATEPGEPIGADSGRGLWLAATLADELSITSGPDSTIVSVYMRLD
jgi:hypothetical protein